MTPDEQAALKWRKLLREPQPVGRCLVDFRAARAVMTNLEPVTPGPSPKKRRAILKQVRHAREIAMTAPADISNTAIATIDQLVEEIEEIVPTKRSQLMMDVGLLTFDQYLTRPFGGAVKVTRRTLRQGAATLQARILLLRWGAKGKELSTRSKVWEQLAAILYGDLDFDSFQYRRDILNNLKIFSDA
jgi:hypothetical protein